jgi:drug/metabolite transporter (DMT)-like permease
MSAPSSHPRQPRSGGQVWPAHVAVFISTILFTALIIFMKQAVACFGLTEVALYRIIFTTVIAMAIELIFIRTRFESLKDLLQVAGLGLLGFYAIQFTAAFGMHYATAFHASLIMANVPVLTLLFAMMLGRERFSLQKIMGLVIGFSGVVLLLCLKNPNGLSSGGSLLGDVMMMGNALCFSLYMIGTQPLVRRYPAFSVMSYGYLSAFLLMLMTTPLAHQVGWLPSFGELAQTLLGNQDGNGWFSLAYIVVLTGIGAYSLNNFALRRLPSSTVSIYSYTQPLMGAVLGAVFLNESFYPMMAVAGLMTLSGVALANMPPLLLERRGDSVSPASEST